VFFDVWRFELDCSETAVTDKSMMIFAKRALPKMTKLRKFAFHANKTKLSDSSLQPLFHNLSVAKDQLITLRLSLSETQVENQSLLALADTLSSLKNLQNLHLWLNQTKVEDSSVNSLWKSLKSFRRNLECLSLGFDGTKVTDEGISDLGTEIAHEMKSLKEFRLWVSKTLVGDAGLRPLFENLNMENIQVLQRRRPKFNGFSKGKPSKS